MKKLNNRGFLLAESLVVSTFVLTVLILLFVQFKSLFNSYEDSYNYNTVEGIYNLNTMKKYIMDNQVTSLRGQMNNGYVLVVENGECNTEIGLAGIIYCDQLVEAMKLKTLIYADSDVSSLKTDNQIFSESFKDFISKIKNESGNNRLLGNFDDGTYATIVYE